MPDLYIVAAQPNPPGRDVAVPGATTNAKLNEEWLEFEARVGRNLAGDELWHVTFAPYCRENGTDRLVRFGTVELVRGDRVRVHTGSGVDGWLGNVLRVYAGRSWFVWNNACGDRATLTYNRNVIDSAYYDPGPPEGELVREPGTNKLVPRLRYVSGW